MVFFLYHQSSLHSIICAKILLILRKKMKGRSIITNVSLCALCKTVTIFCPLFLCIIEIMNGQNIQAWLWVLKREKSFCVYVQNLLKKVTKEQHYEHCLFKIWSILPEVWALFLCQILCKLEFCFVFSNKQTWDT